MSCRSPLQRRRQVRLAIRLISRHARGFSKSPRNKWVRENVRTGADGVQLYQCLSRLIGDAVSAVGRPVMKPWPASVRFCLPYRVWPRAPAQIAVRGLPLAGEAFTYRRSHLDSVVASPARAADDHIIHHIRISTEDEINVAVKSRWLLCSRPISDFLEGILIWTTCCGSS
jgi:hypothetical protein